MWRQLTNNMTRDVLESFLHFDIACYCFSLTTEHIFDENRNLEEITLDLGGWMCELFAFLLVSVVEANGKTETSKVDARRA